MPAEQPTDGARAAALTLLCAAWLALAFGLAPYAQTDAGPVQDDVGNGGRNAIQGRVFLPSGRHPERRFRVRLSSVRGESSTLTDDGGSFTFRRLEGGTYRVTVEAGREFEAAGETVDIFDAGRGGAAQTLTLQIKLEPKRAARAPADPGVVDAALAGVPAEARDLYQKALRAAQSGDHGGAVESLRKAVSLHQNFPLARNELGVQLMRLGQAERAARELREGIRLAPEVAMLRLNYGLVLLQLRDFGGAERALREALGRDASLNIARLYLGRVLIKLARLDEAERELQSALRAGGEPAVTAHRYLGALYIERGDAARAVESLETYLRLAPGAPDAAEVRDIVKQLRAQGAQSKN